MRINCLNIITSSTNTTALAKAIMPSTGLKSKDEQYAEKNCYAQTSTSFPEPF
jgi:hypothetical protein